MKKQFFILFVFSIINFSAQSQYKTIGTVERYDKALDKIVSPNAKAEIIAEGFDWSEGPLWVEKEKMLLWSDVPQNIIYKWTQLNVMAKLEAMV
jgi:gluconolactonase